MRIENPFHSGELEAHRLTGESDTAVRNSVVIADTIIGGALPFLAQQQVVVLASQSAAGDVWASPVFGAPGFVSSPDGRQVAVNRKQAWEITDDPVWQNLTRGAKIGMLAIELSTRRRLRVNGTVLQAGGDALEIEVTESFPNCPKYIQRRTLDLTGNPEARGAEPAAGRPMTVEGAQVIDTADTLFIATSHSERGLDVSHRGGAPGFIQRMDVRTIRVPDYAGNSMFNTLGNLLVNPHAGIAVMDFSQGRMLQMTGTATVEWNQPDDQGITGETRRFWTFTIDAWRILSMPANARWQSVEASPFNPASR